MKRCLFCYQKLENYEVDFHKRCSNKIFNVEKVPLLPYTLSEISLLAEQVIRAQTTITGVQPKLSLDFQKKNNISPPRFTIVGLWGKYILKPPTEIYPNLPELEDVTMHLAQIAKIQTVPHSLIRFTDGELCYITQRIDRDKTGNKIAMEDFCQLSERLTEYKYKGSYEQIAKLIGKYSSSAKLDIINFWEQIVFCWITGNADMHLKNFSLYKPDNQDYMLTPCYDMVATQLILPEDKEEVALNLNGKKLKIDRDDFVVAMKNSGLEEKIIENIFNKFPKYLEKWCDFIDISFLPESMKLEYQNLLRKKIASIHNS